MFINKDLYQKCNTDLKIGQDVLLEWEEGSLYVFNLETKMSRGTVQDMFTFSDPRVLKTIIESSDCTNNQLSFSSALEVVKIASEGVMIQLPEQEDIDTDKLWCVFRNKNTGYWYGNCLQGSLFIKKPVVKISWDKVCLQNEKKKAILNALSQIKYSDLIFNTWGFSETIEKGRALTFLFYGPPGTGKTLTAQAIADYLDFDLMTITPTDLNDKYFGETEKRIREVFTKADSRTVILFDECDGLVMDRGRHEASYMVAHINQFIYDLEHFDGVCIFTTNNIDFLDKALERRLALKVEFDNPNETIRKAIWRKLVPLKCPLGEDVDFSSLAKFPINGGHIKNVVLNAARIAAKDKADKLSMNHFIKAIEFENNGIKGFNKIT